MLCCLCAQASDEKEFSTGLYGLEIRGLFGDGSYGHTTQITLNSPGHERFNSQKVPRRNAGRVDDLLRQDLFGVKERQARKDLRAMVDMKILQVHGGGRSTRYLLPD